MRGRERGDDGVINFISIYETVLTKLQELERFGNRAMMLKMEPRGREGGG